MALKLGDLIPTDCTDVGPLLLRSFKDDGTQHLAKNDSPAPVSIQGGHLLSLDTISNFDYESEALDNNLEVCEDLHIFGEANKLLRLRIESTNSPPPHCSGPTFRHQGTLYPDGYFGSVDGGQPSLVAGVGPYAAGTYNVGLGYVGQPWRLIEYTWTDFSSSQNILQSGVVPGDGVIVYSGGAISGVSPTGGGSNTHGAVAAQIEAQCDGVWPSPPARPF